MKLKDFAQTHKKTYFAMAGALAGAANGLFGSGGGVIAVPILTLAGEKPKNAHASSIGITLPLSIISAAVYFRRGSIDLHAALPYLLPGLLGAAAGAFFLRKISNRALNVTFSLVMVAFGIRLLLK